MADTEPKTEEVLEQKPEETKVEVETAEASSDEPASVDAAPAADKESSDAAAGDKESPDAEADDSHSRYVFRRQQRDETRYSGVVRWFRADKGNFGFISVECEEKGNPDAHVHGDNVECDAEGNIQILEEGQQCTFTLLTRPPPKSDPTGETRYTAKNVIPGEKPKREKKIVKKYKGRCVFFNHAKDKKFGFIKIEPCDDYPTGIDIYVHQDSVKGGKGKGLVEDQEVVCEIQKNEYDLDNGEKEVKLRAINVVPGKAPPEDPEKDMVFNGTCVRWIDKQEDGANKSFGFIRLDNDASREVMVHNSKILSGDKSLVVTQKCRFKISKRKDRNDPTKKLRESAIEVSPGDVPVKKILTGVVRFFDVEKGFGFISRQGHSDKDYYCRVESIIGNDKALEEKQTVTFVAAPSNRPGKPRAVEVRPGKKAVNGEVAELAPEETPFEAYLPAHTEAVKTAKKKKSNLPLHKQIEQDDTMTEAEKAAALKKDFNYRKRMRRKRALAREESDSSSEEKKPVAAPAPVSKPKPTPAPKPVAAPAPQQSKKSKKSKKQQKQEPAPVVEEVAPTPPVQTNSKKKKAPKKQEPQQQAQKEQKKQQQVQQQAAPAVQGNKKKPKRRKNAKKKKGGADKQSQSSEEEDVIDAAFNANKAAREQQNAASAGLFTVLYNYILSFCKTPAPQRKLRR